jgi:hypothetical protein
MAAPPPVAAPPPLASALPPVAAPPPLASALPPVAMPSAAPPPPSVSTCNDRKSISAQAADRCWRCRRCGQKVRPDGAARRCGPYNALNLHGRAYLCKHTDSQHLLRWRLISWHLFLQRLLLQRLQMWRLFSKRDRSATSAVDTRWLSACHGRLHVRQGCRDGLRAHIHVRDTGMCTCQKLVPQAQCLATIYRSISTQATASANFGPGRLPVVDLCCFRATECVALGMVCRAGLAACSKVMI